MSIYLVLLCKCSFVLFTVIGDSRFTVIREANSLCPDLLSSRLLIMEATYLDNPDRKIESARSHGHTHLDEIRQNASLLKVVVSFFLN